MDIRHSTSVPDDTYFGTNQAEPDIDGDVLTLYNGQGTRRSWGTPGITSTLVVHETDLIAVHVGYHHKYHGGQFWRYVVDGKFLTWNQLTVEQQARVLAKQSVAPAWARAPGKLKTERITPANTKRAGFKVLIQSPDGTLHSAYNPEVRYTLGKRMVQAARDRHRGGFYAYQDRALLNQAYCSGKLFAASVWGHVQAGEQFVLVEVEAAGTFIDYPNGKFAATYLTPLRVVEVLPEVSHAR